MKLIILFGERSYVDSNKLSSSWDTDNISFITQGVFFFVKTQGVFLGIKPKELVEHWTTARTITNLNFIYINYRILLEIFRSEVESYNQKKKK